MTLLSRLQMVFQTITHPNRIHRNRKSVSKYISSIDLATGDVHVDAATVNRRSRNMERTGSCNRSRSAPPDVKLSKSNGLVETVIPQSQYQAQIRMRVKKNTKTSGMVMRLLDNRKGRGDATRIPLFHHQTVDTTAHYTVSELITSEDEDFIMAKFVRQPHTRPKKRPSCIRKSSQPDQLVVASYSLTDSVPQTIDIQNHRLGPVGEVTYV